MKRQNQSILTELGRFAVLLLGLAVLLAVYYIAMT
jgi:hypothetical protein